MNATIDMQDMRYLNLFNRITKISTRFCFKYNQMLVFGVPRNLLSRALGPEASNLKKLGFKLRKKVRIVALPNDVKDAKSFIQTIISPVEFNELEVKDGEIVVTAGRANKAALIGRDKRRLNEMKEIVKNFFGRDFRVI